MRGSGSFPKRKPTQKKRDKKKKSRRKEPKRNRRNYDSVSSYSDDDSLKSEHTSSSASKSDHRRRINKNKKLRCDYSVSSYSDDRSSSSDSDSLSSYDSGYKHRKRKARRSRVGLKVTKKKVRNRFASPNSDTDWDNVRKMKRSGRAQVLKPRKKFSKKSRKVSSGSSSSDSESCSTCQSESSSSIANGKRKRSKLILDKEIERPRGRELYKAHKKRKVRSPSCSSCRRGSKHGISVGNRDGTLSPLNNPRRLRSVIAVVDRPDDEGQNRLEKDPHKEEIVYDQDDYPSPKSPDSNDGGSKMELDYHSHHASNKRICVENLVGEEVTELGKSKIDEDDQNNAGEHPLHEAHVNNAEKEKEIDEVQDLESILRQKALENLRKFRGGFQTSPGSTNLKKNKENDMNGPSDVRVDDTEVKSTNQGSSNAQEMDQTGGTSLKRDVSQFKDIPDNEHVEKEPEMAKPAIGHPPDSAVLTKCVSRSNASLEAGATNACSSSTAEPASSVKPISRERSLEQQNEAKDGSQFEQKTMSVMRGGEMVQVSYKVYIPKKAPAMSRRQLKR